MTLSKEQLDYLNEQLLRIFGRFMTTNYAQYRVVWSEDQLEKRETWYTDEGFALLNAEVRELPKYRQWIQNKYVLERLTVVPEFAETDLIVPYNYEPIWVFEDDKGNPLPPRLDACEFVIHAIHAQAAKTVGVKYKHPLAGLNKEEQKEHRRAELDKISKDLFGNETEVGDALAYREGVSVPHNYGDN